MKKISIIFFVLFLLSSYSFSQGEIDAIKYSTKELYGTARSMAMGGSFGALGGDMTGISTNPAGIGVYRSSEISGTFGSQMNKFSIGRDPHNKSMRSIDASNMGFIGYFPLRNEAIPMINFGFSYNKQKNFDGKFEAAGNYGNSLMNFIADRSYGLDPDNLLMPDENSSMPDPFLSQPWLSVLAYNSYLINPQLNSNGKYGYSPLISPNELVQNKINKREKGSIDNYDFTIGTSINNQLNIGLSLIVSEISHYQYSDYQEDFSKGSYVLNNELSVKGSGFGAKLGLIYRPINSLKIGVAYHTPMRYSMQEYYKARIDDNLLEVADVVNEIRPDYKPGSTYSAEFTNSYDLSTPDKWVFSVAGIIGSRFAANIDYELTDYRKMKLHVPSDSSDAQDWYSVDNGYIKSDFKTASTVKFGMEYRFTNQLYGRLGYAWMQNPYNNKFREAGNAAIFNSNVVHVLEGDTHYYTGGFGYRFNQNFYLDLAVVFRTQKDKLFAFPNIYSDESNTNLVVRSSQYEMKNSLTRAIVTLGYKF